MRFLHRSGHVVVVLVPRATWTRRSPDNSCSDGYCWRQPASTSAMAAHRVRAGASSMSRRDGVVPMFAGARRSTPSSSPTPKPSAGAILMPDQDCVRLTRFAPAGRSAGGCLGMTVFGALTRSQPTTALIPRPHETHQSSVDERMTDVSLAGIQSRRGAYQWRTLHLKWWMATGWSLKSI